MVLNKLVREQVPVILENENASHDVSLVRKGAQ